MHTPHTFKCRKVRNVSHMNSASVDILVCLTVHYLYSMYIRIRYMATRVLAMANLSQGAKRPRAINYDYTEPSVSWLCDKIRRYTKLWKATFGVLLSPHHLFRPWTIEVNDGRGRSR